MSSIDTRYRFGPLCHAGTDWGHVTLVPFWVSCTDLGHVTLAARSIESGPKGTVSDCTTTLRSRFWSRHARPRSRPARPEVTSR
eukprot:2090831-Rhodomonas_salina.3